MGITVRFKLKKTALMKKSAQLLYVHDNSSLSWCEINFGLPLLCLATREINTLFWISQLVCSQPNSVPSNLTKENYSCIPSCIHDNVCPASSFHIYCFIFKAYKWEIEKRGRWRDTKGVREFAYIYKYRCKGWVKRHELTASLARVLESFVMNWEQV